MIGDAARSTGATACLELNSIEEGPILWLMLLSLFLLHFILFGVGGCSTWSNDDSWTMMSLVWRGIRIFIINIIVVAVIVVAVAPSTETKRMQEEEVSTPPRRMLELELLFMVSYWSCCAIIIISTPTPSIEDIRRK